MRSAHFIASLFFAFRLSYIPSSILTHTGHGWPWLNVLITLVVVFGGEWLGRRSRRQAAPRREIMVMVIALLLLGLFPEEAPMGVILWAGLGLAWGRLQLAPLHSGLGLGVGLLLGIVGRWGPGVWLVAILLALWGFTKAPSGGLDAVH